MKNNQRRATLTLGVIGGGLLAASFLPMAVAAADEFDFTPDITSFVPSQVEGYPPLINEVTGAEQWRILDIATNTAPFGDDLSGEDTATTIGSFTNDDYLTGSDLSASGFGHSFDMPIGSQIDLANFGLGFENEWIDIPSGPDSGISDLFITPFGDFELLGPAFSDLSSIIQVP
jgi:hypothetical protein